MHEDEPTWLAFVRWLRGQEAIPNEPLVTPHAIVVTENYLYAQTHGQTCMGAWAAMHGLVMGGYISNA